MWRLAPRVLVLFGCAALSAGAAPAGAPEDHARVLGLIEPNRQQQAKDFNVAALEGGKVRLADLKGKVVFLNLWATWCGPCMDSSGAKIVKPFIEQSKFTYRVALDPKMEIAQLYGARAVPSTYIIDRGGVLRAIALGPRDWDGKASLAYFDALLKDGKPSG